MFSPRKLICFHLSMKKLSKLGRKNFPVDEAIVVHVHNDLCCRCSPPLLHSISCFYLHTLNREKRTFQKIKSSMCTMFTMTYAAVALNFSLAGSLYQLLLLAHLIRPVSHSSHTPSLLVSCSCTFTYGLFVFRVTDVINDH